MDSPPVAARPVQRRKGQLLLQCAALVAGIAVAASWGWRSDSVLGEAQAPGAELYRSRELSGCNLLYLYATAHQVAVDYARVRELISRGNRLTTLRDVEVGAKALGVDACVRKLAASDFPSLPMPIIAHLDGWNESPGVSGEFLLVIAREGSVFEVMSGISCAPTIMTEDEFFKRWAGFAIVASSPWAWQYPASGAACLLLVALVLYKRDRAGGNSAVHSSVT